MCSPALLRDKARPLKRPQDLAHHTLLHFDYAGAETMYIDWGTWLTALGIGELKSAGALHFSQYEQMIQAAISGQGVALGRQPLVSDLIESGVLVAPFKQTLVGSRAYFIIESRLSAGKPQVREFAQWLIAETRAAGGYVRAMSAPTFGSIAASRRTLETGHVSNAPSWQGEYLHAQAWSVQPCVRSFTTNSALRHTRNFTHQIMQLGIESLRCLKQGRIFTDHYQRRW